MKFPPHCRQYEKYCTLLFINTIHIHKYYQYLVSPNESICPLPYNFPPVAGDETFHQLLPCFRRLNKSCLSATEAQSFLGKVLLCTKVTDGLSQRSSSLVDVLTIRITGFHLVKDVCKATWGGLIQGLANSMAHQLAAFLNTVQP